ncbi:MAG TPA: gamma-glutamyl-gamma-aminobutyrate hydrolase family protein, partial [Rugosimonospora sp.]|nr:gamma-glutamyl-gamma-aminobutyrate hydrolase family protein [Rugosimonospora sp.]
MTRPVIGLTTYAEPARYGPGELPSAMLPMAYVRAVHEAGGTAVLVPPGSDVLEVLDGVIFTGGADLGPDLYGAAPHETTVARPDRDAAELG